MQVTVWNKAEQTFETKEFSLADFDLVFQYFIDLAEMVCLDHYKEMGYNINLSFKVEAGSKYLKVVRYDPHGSVHCFVERATGNIYKAASYKVPAKHIRGNIFSFDNGLAALTPYGIVYLR